ncbi:putative nucleotidyltransferase, Ribonuclease H [Helianthus annuus]|nr:putative nucleotidyltransferase, Ribonuclease H [Helianthus annuus]KAJ0644289.1 putative nucleotidyltransferase, Ribonuclease H [Helianthus annuus]
MCRKFKWMMQGMWFEADVMVIPLESYDMVLGIQWLAPLGDIVWNFNQLTMEFSVNGVKKVLKGVNNSGISLCSMEQMEHMLSHPNHLVPSQMFEIQLTSLEGQNGQSTNVSKTMLDTRISKLIYQYKEVFAEPKGLPPSRSCDHRIELKDEDVSINLKPYRYQSIQKDVIEKMTEELLNSGVIRASTSSFAAPVVLVKKKDGTWRMCVDYRQLNNATVKNSFPIPLIDELLEELKGAAIFSKLDLRSGYHQVRMYADDIYKTAFRTHQGLFEFLVMPFGLTNAPATFQALMNQTFKPFLRKFVLVFFDDILIYSQDIDQHLVHLEKVLLVLKEQQLFAKQSKCCFGGQQVEYLGHIITKEGVATDPKKIESVQGWPIPTNVKQLRGFLGLAGYYRKFIRSFGVIAKPLTELTKKDSFKWSITAQQAFEQLKHALTEAPVLALPDLNKPFIIETDASSKGVGAVLIQDNHPLAFFSKALCPRQMVLSVYEKELLAIIMAIKQWHYYLVAKPFIIRTDQKSLKHLLTQKITTPLQHSWLSKLMGYNYEIHYKKGVENVAADALSRLESSSVFTMVLSSFDPLLLSEIKKSWQDDVSLRAIIQKISQGQVVHKYTWMDGLLKRKQKLVVGADVELRKRLIHLCHSSSMGGHSGVHATYQRLKSFFYWKGQIKQIRELIRNCNTCQQAKPDHAAYPGLLQPLPIPTEVWADISMDFITGLPKSQGKEVIFVVVDRLTKYAHFMPLSHPFTALQVAQLFLDNVFKLHGWPSTIVSDRDTIFLSNFWKEFTRLQGISVAMSTAYHPQSDGQTEVVNRCLETYLRCMTMERPNSWMKWLSLAEFWYNTNFHTAIQTTPFQALYGYSPPLHVPYVHRDSMVASVDDFMVAREETVKLLRDSLLKAQNRMQQQANKHRSDREFAVGDWVFLKLQNYVQSSIRGKPYNKLSPKYFGPYLITQKIGTVAYKLDLPDDANIHPTFHVSLLKKANGPPVTVIPIPKGHRFSLQPATILDSRVIRRGNRAAGQLLVKWNGLPDSDATWEFKDDFLLRFPDFQLDL